MLFKFIWVAITALALYGCPGDDEDDDKTETEEGTLSFSGGAATIDADSKVTVKGTVKEGDEAKEGVEVIFTVTCGSEDAHNFAAVKSDEDGLATSAASVVAGADDKDALEDCKVTAKVDGITDDVVIQAGKAAAEMMMGMVHDLDWAVNTTATVCTKAVIYKISGSNGETLAVVDQAALRATSGGDVKVLVLPTEASVTDDCEIGDTTIKAKAAAFNATVAVANMGCSAATCWKLASSDGTNLETTTYADPARGDHFIKKTGNNYVYHDVQ